MKRPQQLLTYWYEQHGWKWICYLGQGNIGMDIFQIDEQQNLFISPEIDDWCLVSDLGITAVFDLDGDADVGVPAVPNQMLYVFFPFEDARELPNLEKLHEVARLGVGLMRLGVKILVHCGMGHNRCALVTGVMLTYLGMSGTEAVTLIRSKRQGALYNRQFASYVESLPRVELPEVFSTATLSPDLRMNGKSIQPDRLKNKPTFARLALVLRRVGRMLQL